MTATSSQPGAFETRSLADIAATLPGATSLFRRHKLDFCCGGRMSLAEAATAKGIPLPELQTELDTLAARPPTLSGPETTQELIARIETHYHAVHRRELPELMKLARRVEAAHKDHPAVPRGLAALLQTMADDLDSHMRQEEQVLFPLMRHADHAALAQPVAAMLAEHDEHGERLRELAARTADFTPPESACPTWRALYVGLRKFSDDLMDHVHTENNLLFPRFAD